MILMMSENSCANMLAGRDSRQPQSGVLLSRREGILSFTSSSCRRGNESSALKMRYYTAGKGFPPASKRTRVLICWREGIPASIKKKIKGDL